MEKKRIWIFVFIALLFLSGTVSSLSIFSDRADDHLTVNIGTIILGLNDQTVGPDGVFYPTEDDMKVIPGSTVQKRVTAENLGDYAIWLRIKPKPTINSVDGQILPDAIEDKDGVPVPLVTFHFSESEKWSQGEDGYWYYAKPLDPNMATDPFLYDVSFSHDLNRAEYLSSHVAVVVEAHAVQAQNTGTSAEDAIGWPSEEE